MCIRTVCLYWLLYFTFDIRRYLDFSTISSCNTGLKNFIVLFFGSMLIEFDRFCQQRFVTLVPVLDVSHHVDYEKLTSLYPLFLDYLSCFTYTR